MFLFCTRRFPKRFPKRPGRPERHVEACTVGSLLRWIPWTTSDSWTGSKRRSESRFVVVWGALATLEVGYLDAICSVCLVCFFTWKWIIRFDGEKIFMNWNWYSCILFDLALRLIECHRPAESGFLYGRCLTRAPCSLAVRKGVYLQPAAAKDSKQRTYWLVKGEMK